MLDATLTPVVKEDIIIYFSHIYFSDSRMDIVVRTMSSMQEEECARIVRDFENL
jgi:hypothetical protein